MLESPELDLIIINKESTAGGSSMFSSASLKCFAEKLL